MAANTSKNGGRRLTNGMNYKDSKTYFDKLNAGEVEPKHRLSGPETQVVLREGRVDAVKIPIFRRVLSNWSLEARQQLAGRSRETKDWASKVVTVPSWADEEGVRWLLGWMSEKCRANDIDDHLYTKQQLQGQKKNTGKGVRELDETDVVLLFRCHQAARALHFPQMINHLYDPICHLLRKRPLDAYELSNFWSVYGTATGQETVVLRMVDDMARHMLNGTKGDYDAIESLVDKHPNLQQKLYEQLEAKAATPLKDPSA